ncbi:hypothetical protein BJX61DRAFT_540505 [Aspergillus egyptiacus]|nr:hypothetical protein BJX61DRAFT_540505 [Aspergillus egyptiacus]
MPTTTQPDLDILSSQCHEISKAWEALLYSPTCPTDIHEDLHVGSLEVEFLHVKHWFEQLPDHKQDILKHDTRNNLSSDSPESAAQTCLLFIRQLHERLVQGYEISTGARTPWFQSTLTEAQQKSQGCFDFTTGRRKPWDPAAWEARRATAAAEAAAFGGEDTDEEESDEERLSELEECQWAIHIIIGNLHGFMTGVYEGNLAAED